MDIESVDGLVPWATSHFLSQCYLKSLRPYCVTRSQLTIWVVLFNCSSWRCLFIAIVWVSPTDDKLLCKVYYFGLNTRSCIQSQTYSLEWRHYERECVLTHQRLDCLLNRLFWRRSKKISKPRVTGLCEGNLPVSVGFPSQKASNAEMFPFHDVIML